MTIFLTIFALMIGASPNLNGFRLELPDFIQSGAAVAIESDEVVWQAKGGGVRFEGHVRLQQGDFSLTCTRLTVVTGEDGGVLRVEAVGEVALRRNHWKASAQRADFDIARSNLRLSGEPEMHRKGQVLSGREIVIDMKNDTVRATGAKAVFQLDELKNSSSESAETKKP